LLDYEEAWCYKLELFKIWLLLEMGLLLGKEWSRLSFLVDQMRERTAVIAIVIPSQRRKLGDGTNTREQIEKVAVCLGRDGHSGCQCRCREAAAKACSYQ
jgi:hypothetical protein